MKKCIMVLLSLVFLFTCTVVSAEETGVEDGVLTVAMECAYAPYNWAQPDDSNGAVPIAGSTLYANGYDVMTAKAICEANGWDLESQLSQALKNQKYTSIDAKVKNVELSRLKGRIYTDYGDFSYRVDGNNVDPEQEQVELASNQLKYQGLIQAMTKEFANIKSVLK